MRAPVLFILLTMMIDAMGIGLMIPVMPDLLQDVGARDLSTAALWGGVLATSFAAMQFLFGPVIGGLSDRFGRRPVLLISLVVMALDYLVMAIAGSIWLLLLGRTIGGIAAATQPTANAFMADISAPEDRALPRPRHAGRRNAAPARPARPETRSPSPLFPFAPRGNQTAPARIAIRPSPRERPEVRRRRSRAPDRLRR